MTVKKMERTIFKLISTKDAELLFIVFCISNGIFLMCNLVGISTEYIIINIFCYIGFAYIAVFIYFRALRL